MASSTACLIEVTRQWQGSCLLLDTLMNRLEYKFDSLAISVNAIDLLLAEAMACVAELDMLANRVGGKQRPQSLRQFYCVLSTTLSDWQLKREQSSLRTGCCSLLTDYGRLMPQLSGWFHSITSCAPVPHPREQSLIVDSSQHHPA
ncbi:hypothetical protein MJ923_20690 [Shewanella sp. 3B26]|uniref:Uncharacterized protein n=1 Tax=Shewanella zhuhaiensis TaxID=2919576 RepID=A0AAJ1BKS9_9GAMM|nr:hypothetical protein [Shewanella zhuhaiensis]MCH4296725.1 hypothetical protein [Shewanella zhuhaiensis]